MKHQNCQIVLINFLHMWENSQLFATFIKNNLIICLSMKDGNCHKMDFSSIYLHAMYHWSSYQIFHSDWYYLKSLGWVTLLMLLLPVMMNKFGVIKWICHHEVHSSGVSSSNESSSVVFVQMIFQYSALQLQLWCSSWKHWDSWCWSCLLRWSLSGSQSFWKRN